MKKYIIITCMLFPVLLQAQSGFSPEDFMNFRQSNSTLSTQELMQLYPVQNTYYSTRTNEPDLKDLPWYDSLDMNFGFTKDEQALLKENYFMVSERIFAKRWSDMLAQLYMNDLPFFLTTDLILYTLHQSYDAILKQIEIKILEPNLKKLLQEMGISFVDVYEKYKSDPELKNSLDDVDLYLAVANSLSTGSRIIPDYADSSMYSKVMRAIANEKQVDMSLFTRYDLPRKLDFSQFKPRGHYNEVYYTNEGEKTLENYFRTMMWLGRIDFLMTPPPPNPWDEPWKIEDIRRMNLSALILNEVLHSSNSKDLLDIHEEIISFMVGPDDNLTPDELKDITIANLSDISELYNNDKLDSFVEVLNSSDDYGQKIMSNFFFVDPDTLAPGALPISFKLLGQKFLIDSYIFSEVVFDRIVFDNKKQWRLMPDPLDILAVFGNENALVQLEEEMNTYKYAYKINELKYLVDSYDEEFWTQSLYNTWLSAVLALDPPEDHSKFPYFMKTVPWQYEKMNTQLTSWAQLRHDNILYGKQSYTGGTGCSYPFTYVEPYPEFYKRLAVFAENASQFFSDLLDGSEYQMGYDISAYYDNYAEVMTTLEGISRKELNRVSLNEQELVFLKTMINEYMASGPGISGWLNDLLYPGIDMWGFDYTVADVHTQPTDSSNARVGKVLHVGNGYINLAVIIAPCTTDPYKSMCYAGPVGSFHTKVEKNFYRLNDDEWKAFFMNEEKRPPRPEWVYTYLADSDGDSLDVEASLKGIVYTGSGEVSHESSALEYLLVFPNPADDNIHFRFVLDSRAIVNASVFDISGRLITNLYSGTLPSSEQDLELPLGEVAPGIYIYHMTVNDQAFMKRFVVK